MTGLAHAFLLPDWMLKMTSTLPSLKETTIYLETIKQSALRVRLTFNNNLDCLI